METLEQRIARHEGEKLRPYKDSRGFWSIGIGRCLDTKGITHEEAIYLLKNDLVAAKDGVAKSLPWFQSLDESRQGVLIEMAFQLGLAGLMHFPKMLAYCKDGAYGRAAEEMINSAWHTQTPDRCEELAEVMLNGY